MELTPEETKEIFISLLKLAKDSESLSDMKKFMALAEKVDTHYQKLVSGTPGTTI